jgi:antitoxin (DNA-binding transcriptional repressor) of toxin-antitoxin stability system
VKAAPYRCISSRSCLDGHVAHGRFHLVGHNRPPRPTHSRSTAVTLLIVTAAHDFELSADDPSALARAVKIAEAGSVVRLTRHGKPVAEVSPYHPGLDQERRMSENLSALFAEAARQRAECPDGEARHARIMREFAEANGGPATPADYAEFLRSTGMSEAEAAAEAAVIAEGARALLERHHDSSADRR